eukprot:gene3539-2025_t
MSTRNRNILLQIGKVKLEFAMYKKLMTFPPPQDAENTEQTIQCGVTMNISYHQVDLTAAKKLLQWQQRSYMNCMDSNRTLFVCGWYAAVLPLPSTVICKENVVDVLEDLHYTQTIGRETCCVPGGINALRKIFTSKYYFKEIPSFLKGCKSCFNNTPLSSTQIAPLKPIRSFRPHERLQIDDIPFRVYRNRDWNTIGFTVTPEDSILKSSYVDAAQADDESATSSVSGDECSFGTGEDDSFQK